MQHREVIEMQHLWMSELAYRVYALTLILLPRSASLSTAAAGGGAAGGATGLLAAVTGLACGLAAGEGAVGAMDGETLEMVIEIASLQLIRKSTLDTLPDRVAAVTSVTLRYSSIRHRRRSRATARRRSKRAIATRDYRHSSVEQESFAATSHKDAEDRYPSR
jgi:hypothetical protein